MDVAHLDGELVRLLVERLAHSARPRGPDAPQRAVRSACRRPRAALPAACLAPCRRSRVRPAREHAAMQVRRDLQRRSLETAGGSLEPRRALACMALSWRLRVPATSVPRPCRARCLSPCDIASAGRFTGGRACRARRVVQHRTAPRSRPSCPPPPHAVSLAAPVCPRRRPAGGPPVPLPPPGVPSVCPPATAKSTPFPLQRRPDCVTSPALSRHAAHAAVCGVPTGKEQVARCAPLRPPPRRHGVLRAPLSRPPSLVVCARATRDETDNRRGSPLDRCWRDRRGHAAAARRVPAARKGQWEISRVH